MKKLDKDSKGYLKLLGQRIVELRKQKNLTQVQLAEKLDTEHAQIGRLERGETNCTIIILRRIAKELNLSISELVDVK